MKNVAKITRSARIGTRKRLPTSVARPHHAALIGSETALGFVFDPRYRDFPYAALTMAVVPFATLLLNRPKVGRRPVAETVFAGLLAGSAVYIGLNEGRDNWQSLWTCAIYLLFAVTLWQARAVQSPK